MRLLSAIALAGAVIASPAAAFAGELPSYEVKSFPISAVQVQVLGGGDVEEPSTAAATTIAGMPASPVQLLALSPQAKRVAQAGSQSKAQ